MQLRATVCLVLVFFAIFSIGCDPQPRYTGADVHRYLLSASQPSNPDTVSGNGATQGSVQELKPVKVPPFPDKPQPANESQRVLVVANKNSQDSLSLAAYYMQRRKIPAANLVLVDTPATVAIPEKDYETTMRTPVFKAIEALPYRIDYIAMMYGTPYRLKDWSHSIDAYLASLYNPQPYMQYLTEANMEASRSQYFQKDEEFDSAKYKLFLVTRLDGPDPAAVRRLIDNSINAKPNKGPFLFNKALNRGTESYGFLQSRMDLAAADLKKRGFDVDLTDGSVFQGSPKPLAGYVSWGSNDGRFDAATYAKLSFLPGAIAETFVSTSALDIEKPTPGQSKIRDLIGNGVTGVKGYVTEPYTFSMCWVDILFNRYTRGYNLAESFYMSFPITRWNDVVVGDPLCRPYPKSS